MSGMTSTMARVRGSRRIWMNSLATMDQTRAIIEVLALRGLVEGRVDRQPGFEGAVRVGHADRDAKHQVLAVLLGLDVARREFGAHGDRPHPTAEHAIGEGVRF